MISGNGILLLLLLLICGTLYPQTGGSVSTGADWVLPVGNLAKRFVPVPALSAAALWSGTGKTAWGAGFTYSRFSKVNEEALTVTRKVTAAGKTTAVTLPVRGLQMRLSAVTLSLQAAYSMVNTGWLSVSAVAGFGVTRWQFSRSAYDSLSYDTSGTGSAINFIYKAPAASQQDWSGTLNLGLQAEVPVAAGWGLAVNVGYRNILAELWPALAFDMENVSSLQTVFMGIGVFRRW